MATRRGLHGSVGFRGCRSCLASAACFALLVAAAPTTLAQGQMPLFSSKTTTVQVDVLVTDRGLPVRGLSAADFDLRDNGSPQSVNVAQSSSAPINVVLAFDASGSTEGKRLTDLIDAGRALIGGLTPVDRIGLITFSHAVVVRSPLTTDFPTVVSALMALAPSGQTAIMDGVQAALMMTQLEPGRSLVIVCTDGRDTQSWLQAAEVAEVAKRSNAVIYAVAAGAARRWSDLKSLADETGGHMIEIERTSDFQQELLNVLREFRSRYILTFTPTNAAAGYHRLDVGVRRSGVTVRARPGYISVGSGGRP